MYGFNKDSYPTLNAAATEAVQRIYGAGLMFRNGQLTAGGNNVMADNAANAFETFDLSLLEHSADPVDKALAHIIDLRQTYAKAKGPNPDLLLQQIYGAAQILKTYGFKMRDEPHALGVSPAPRAPQLCP